VTPRRYSGVEDVDVWADHSDRVIRANAWADDVAAANLSLALEGAAEEKFTSYSQNVQESWRQLKAALVRDFGLSTAKAKQMMASLAQGEEEKLATYAKRVRRVVMASVNSLTDLPEVNFEELVIQHFRCGLRPDIKRVARLKFENVKTLEVLLVRLEPLERDGIFQTPQPAAQNVHRLEDSSEIEQLREEVKRMSVRLEDAERGVGLAHSVGAESSSGYGTTAEEVYQIETRECYRCKEVGHLMKDCPRNRGAGSGRGQRGQPMRSRGRGRARGRGSQNYRGRQGNRTNDIRELVCYNCGGLGHYQQDCPSDF